MNVLRKILVGVGSIVVVALVLALASPKAVHAIVSALVTVSNTAANPVPTIGAEAGRAFVVENSCFFVGATSCFIVPLYTVPPGETAVIESGSYECAMNTGTAIMSVPISFTVPGGRLASVFLQSAATVSGVSGSSAGESQNIKSYAGPGDIDVSFQTSGSQSSGCNFTLSGYLVP